MVAKNRNAEVHSSPARERSRSGRRERTISVDKNRRSRSTGRVQSSQNRHEGNNERAETGERKERGRRVRSTSSSMPKTREESRNGRSSKARTTSKRDQDQRHQTPTRGKSAEGSKKVKDRSREKIVSTKDKDKNRKGQQEKRRRPRNRSKQSRGVQKQRDSRSRSERDQKAAAIISDLQQEGHLETVKTLRSKSDMRGISPTPKKAKANQKSKKIDIKRRSMSSPVSAKFQSRNSNKPESTEDIGKKKQQRVTGTVTKRLSKNAKSSIEKDSRDQTDDNEDVKRNRDQSATNNSCHLAKAGSYFQKNEGGERNHALNLDEGKKQSPKKKRFFSRIAQTFQKNREKEIKGAPATTNPSEKQNAVIDRVSPIVESNEKKQEEKKLDDLPLQINTDSSSSPIAKQPTVSDEWYHDARACMLFCMSTLKNGCGNPPASKDSTSPDQMQVISNILQGCPLTSCLGLCGMGETNAMESATSIRDEDKTDTNPAKTQGISHNSNRNLLTSCVELCDTGDNDCSKLAASIRDEDENTDSNPGKTQNTSHNSNGYSLSSCIELSDMGNSDSYKSVTSLPKENENTNSSPGKTQNTLHNSNGYSLTSCIELSDMGDSDSNSDGYSLYDSDGYSLTSCIELSNMGDSDSYNTSDSDSYKSVTSLREENENSNNNPAKMQFTSCNSNGYPLTSCVELCKTDESESESDTDTSESATSIQDDDTEAAIQDDDTEAASIQEGDTEAASIQDGDTEAASIQDGDTEAASIQDDDTEAASIRDDDTDVESHSSPNEESSEEPSEMSVAIWMWLPFPSSPKTVEKVKENTPTMISFEPKKNGCIEIVESRRDDF